MHKETRVYYIYINISIYCISFFVKAVLSYKCMDAMHHGILNKIRQYNDLYPQRYDCRKWNKTSLSMHCVFCHYTITLFIDINYKELQEELIQTYKLCRLQMSCKMLYMYTSTLTASFHKRSFPQLKLAITQINVNKYFFIFTTMCLWFSGWEFFHIPMFFLYEYTDLQWETIESYQINVKNHLV